jgi:hypothetical protein
MPFTFKPTQAEGGHIDAISEPVPASPSSFNFSGRLPEGTGFFQKILVFIFCFLIAAAIVLFGYKWYLSSKLEAKKQQLTQYEDELGKLPLDEMRALSNRIKFVNSLLKTHPSVNAAFRIVEDSVENPVTYSRFNLRYDEAKKTYVLQLSAIAPDYKTVVQQMETLKTKPYTSYISNVFISGLRPDDTGHITFEIKMNIMIAGVLPEELLLGTSPAIEQQSPSGAASTTASTTMAIPAGAGSAGTVALPAASNPLKKPQQ